jgi:membrane protease YdiL (CAAX protease family)
MRPASFGLRVDRLGPQAAWGLAPLGCMYAAFYTASLLVVAVLAMTSGLEGEYHRRVEFAEALPVESLVSTLILLVAVAIHEEILFRGLLLPYLRRLLGSWWWAGLASALLFAALHVPGQGLLAGVQVFSIAIVLTVFFILSRSLLAVTAAHLLFNFFQFQLIRMLPKLEELLDAVEA